MTTQKALVTWHFEIQKQNEVHSALYNHLWGVPGVEVPLGMTVWATPRLVVCHSDGASLASVKMFMQHTELRTYCFGTWMNQQETEESEV